MIQWNVDQVNLGYNAWKTRYSVWKDNQRCTTSATFLTEQFVCINKLEASTKTTSQYSDFPIHFQQWDWFLLHNSSIGNNIRAVNTGFPDQNKQTSHRSTRSLLSLLSRSCLPPWYHFLWAPTARLALWVSSELPHHPTLTGAWWTLGSPGCSQTPTGVPWGEMLVKLVKTAFEPITHHRDSSHLYPLINFQFQERI